MQKSVHCALFSPSRVFSVSRLSFWCHWVCSRLQNSICPQMILSRVQGGVFTLVPVSHVSLAFVLDLSERRVISSCSTIIIHVHSWSPSVQLCLYTVKMLADKEADGPAEGGNLTVTSGTLSVHSGGSSCSW